MKFLLHPTLNNNVIQMETIIKRRDGKQWEIKFDYKKHKLYLKKLKQNK